MFAVPITMDLLHDHLWKALKPFDQEVFKKIRRVGMEIECVVRGVKPCPATCPCAVAARGVPAKALDEGPSADSESDDDLPEETCRVYLPCGRNPIKPVHWRSVDRRAERRIARARALAKAKAKEDQGETAQEEVEGEQPPLIRIIFEDMGM